VVVVVVVVVVVGGGWGWGGVGGGGLGGVVVVVLLLWHHRSGLIVTLLLLPSYCYPPTVTRPTVTTLLLITHTLFVTLTLTFSYHKSEINSNPSCQKTTREYATNPAIQFASPDLSMTRVFTSSQVELIQPTGLQRNTVFVMKTMAANACTGASVHKGSNIFMKVDNTYFRLDPRLKLITNTMAAPADIDQSTINAATPGQCPSVTRSFVNGGSCVQRTLTCAPMT
jgi:hypothetical protein